MKKYLVFLLILSVKFSIVNAQSYLTTLSGLTYKEVDYSDVKGSPYAFDGWATSTVQTTKGIYNNVEVKFSELDDQLYFKGKNQEIMLFAEPVKDFTYIYSKDNKSLLTHYRNGYNIPGINSEAYFEVLADGKVQLLKKTTKKIQQQVVYGSTESNKSFMATNRYYIVTPEKSSLIKKDTKSILTALGSKQTELENYIKANNINVKDDADLIKLFAYYNSIN